MIAAALIPTTLTITNEHDIVKVRTLVREWLVQSKYSLIKQTKFMTAASELARNTLIHGGGGEVHFYFLTEALRSGIKLLFEDHGPGIADMTLAMTDGYTSKNGMGMGLSGSKRLVDDFILDSQVGKGTRVSITAWK